MKNFVKCLSALLLSFTFSVGEESAFIDQYLAREVEVDYPYLRTHSSEYYIFAAQENTPEQLLSLLSNENYKADWPKIIHVLGTLSADEESDVPLIEMRRVAAEWETSSNLSEQERLQYLEKAYSALANEGSEESLDFLKLRTQREFWEGRMLPKGTYSISHSNRKGQEITARSEAILAIGKHPLEAAERYLKDLYGNPDFHDDEVLRERLESQFRMRSTWMNLHQKRLRAFETRTKLAGQIAQPAKDTTVRAAVAENLATPSAPEIIQEIEEATPPELVIEGTAEVAPVEVAEETTEQSSQWWLWLVGAVVVVGGLGLVLRRKN